MAVMLPVKNRALNFPSVRGSILLLATVFVLFSCADKSTQEYLSESEQFVNEGDNKAAIVVLKNAIQHNPRNGQLRFKLGIIYLSINDFASSEKELLRALDLGYSATKVIPLLAEAMERSGANVALSELAFETSQLTAPEKLEVGYRKVASLVILEKNDEAKVLIEQLLLLDSNTVYRGLLQAYDEIIKDNKAAALKIAASMYERSPLNRDVLSLTASLYASQEDMQNAATMYINYVKAAPQDSEAKFLLANLLMQLDQTEKAEVYIDQLLLLSQDNPLLLQLKSIARVADSDYKSALLYAKKSISSGRKDPTLRLVAGLSAFKLSNYEEALAHLTLIAAELPNNHPALKMLAASQLQLNLAVDAGAVLNRVSLSHESDVPLFSEAGYALIQAGDINAAKKIIKRADDIVESAQNLERLGELKISLNDVSGIINLESAVSEAPDLVSAQTTLAEAYLTFDQLDKAAALAKQMQSQSDTKLAGLLIESEILQRKNDVNNAQKALALALEIDENNIDAKIADIRLALRLEEIEQALLKTESLLQIAPTNIQGLSSLFAIKAYYGDIEEALLRTKSLVEQYPNDVQLALILAKNQLANADSLSALETLKVFESSKFVPLEFWPLQARVLDKQNQQELLKQHYARWALVYPYNESPILGQLALLDKERDYQSGLSLSSEFLTRKDSQQVALLKSYFSVMIGDAKTAKALLSNIDEALLELPFTKGVLARVALIERRPYEAVENAKTSYLANSNTNNLFLYVQALDETNKAEESYTLLVAHTEKQPQDIYARVLLGERLLIKDPDAAIANYQGLLVDFPNNAVFLNNLAYLQMQKGDLIEAEKNAIQAYQIDKSNVATSNTYAQILMQQKRYAEALGVYDRVMSSKVTNEEVLTHYIEALLRSGNTVLAKRRIEGVNLQQQEFILKLQVLRNEFDL